MNLLPLYLDWSYEANTQERECKKLKNNIQCFIVPKLEPHQKKNNQ